MTVGVVHYSLLCANDCDFVCLVYYFGLCRPFVVCGVPRTAVQMPMLRGSRGWLFSVSEAPDAVNRVHVDLAGNRPLV